MKKDQSSGVEGGDACEAPSSDAIGAAWEARKREKQHDPDTPREAFFAGALWAAAGVQACGSNGTADCQSTPPSQRCAACPHSVRVDGGANNG